MQAVAALNSGPRRLLLVKWVSASALMDPLWLNGGCSRKPFLFSFYDCCRWFTKLKHFFAFRLSCSCAVSWYKIKPAPAKKTRYFILGYSPLQSSFYSFFPLCSSKNWGGWVLISVYTSHFVTYSKFIVYLHSSITQHVDDTKQARKNARENVRGETIERGKTYESESESSLPPFSVRLGKRCWEA